MDIDLEPGAYVVAVSGGVDSMALLHALAGQPRSDFRFTVAHFDHGIREDSRVDRQLVQETAHRYGLPFVYHTGQLGPHTSEARARKARYDFLHKVRQASGAKAIITAHHQDDALETVLLNLVRGTGRKGFSSLASTDIVKRPILHLKKDHLRQYAHDNQLVWREDSTNQDTRYLRNYLRHNVLNRLTPEQRVQLTCLVQRMHLVNQEIDAHLALLLHMQPSTNTLDRKQFILLPHSVGLELLAAWLRRQGVRTFDRKTLSRLSIAAKTYQSGRRVDVNAQWYMLVGKQQLALVARDR